MHSVNKSVVLIKDLLLKSKIVESANTKGVSVAFARDKDKLIEKLKEENYANIILDLSLLNEDLKNFIQVVKNDHPNARIISFCSHVEKDKFQEAQEAGIDKVLPRSKFFSDIISYLE